MPATHASTSSPSTRRENSVTQGFTATQPSKPLSKQWVRMHPTKRDRPSAFSPAMVCRHSFIEGAMDEAPHAAMIVSHSGGRFFSGHEFMTARCAQRFTRFASQRSCGFSLFKHSTAISATFGLSDSLSSLQRVFAKLPHPPSTVG